jgi:protease I
MPNKNNLPMGILLENLYEDPEFWYPYYRLKEAGFEVKVIAPELKEYTSKHGYPAKPDVSVDKIKADELAGLVIPGGYSPDHMRRNKKMVELVEAVYKAGKPVAAICHAGWMLASACILKGKTITSFYSIKDDMINAGAQWVDKPVVVDGNIITSRFPPDLPDFMKAVLKALGGSAKLSPGTA